VVGFVSGACGRKAPVPVPRMPPQTRAPEPSAPSPPTLPAPGPVAPPPAPTSPAAPAPAPPPSVAPSSARASTAFGPTIRIGLHPAATRVRISCPNGLYIEERRPEAIRELIRGEVEVRIESPEGAGAAIFRVQVAALSDRQAADELARRLSEQFALP